MNEREEFWKGMKELERNIGKLTDGWGRFVEGIVSPAAVKKFRRLGYKIIEASHRHKLSQNGRVVAEYDTLIECEKDGEKFLMIGEASTLMTALEVKEFMSKLETSRKYLPRYADCKFIGFVACVNYGRGADSYAVRNGLYVFKPSGETMKLDVPKGFKPKIWDV